MKHIFTEEDIGRLFVVDDVGINQSKTHIFKFCKIHGNYKFINVEDDTCWFSYLYLNQISYSDYYNFYLLGELGELLYG